MVGKLFQAFTLLGSEWVLWLLLILSVVSVAIIFERFRSLRNQERVGARLWKDRLEKTAQTRDFSGLKGSELAKSYPCLESEVLALLESAGPKVDSDKVLGGFLMRKRLELEKNLAFLGTVGSNAPFVGLFGTVLGIIKAFHDMGSQVESAGAQVISIGISEALVATAVGLLVAIPATVFYNYFLRKIKTIVGRADSLGQMVVGTQK